VFPRDIWANISFHHSIKKLKEKLEAQREHLNKLDQHIKEMEAERSGGEHH